MKTQRSKVVGLVIISLVIVSGLLINVIIPSDGLTLKNTSILLVFACMIVASFLALQYQSKNNTFVIRDELVVRAEEKGYKWASIISFFLILVTLTYYDSYKPFNPPIELDDENKLYIHRYISNLKLFIIVLLTTSNVLLGLGISFYLSKFGMSDEDSH
jgi:hypothetical protein